MSLRKRDAVRHRREPRHRSRDRVAGGPRWRQIVVVAAKTAEPHPKLPGTIYTAALSHRGGRRPCAAARGRRARGAEVAAAVEKAVATFGGIDILVNNASAISLTGTLQTPMRIYDRMMTVNTRGTFACSQACLPHLKRSSNPHILNLSPPLNMDARWFAPHVAYTMAEIRHEPVRARHGRASSPPTASPSTRSGHARRLPRPRSSSPSATRRC